MSVDHLLLPAGGAPGLAGDHLGPKNIKPGGSNYSQWNHPRATELIEAGRSTAVQEKRKALYQEVQRILFDETALIPLYSAIGVDMFHKHVEELHSMDGLTGTMTSVEGVWLNK